MRSEDPVLDQEDRGGRGESSSAKVETWAVIHTPSKKETAAKLTEELFGDVLSKVMRMMEKDKKKLRNELRKRHGRR